MRLLRAHCAGKADARSRIMGVQPIKFESSKPKNHRFILNRRSLMIDNVWQYQQLPLSYPDLSRTTASSNSGVCYNPSRRPTARTMQ